MHMAILIDWAQSEPVAPVGLSYSFNGTINNRTETEHSSPVLLLLLVTMVKARGPAVTLHLVKRACLQQF